MTLILRSAGGVFRRFTHPRRRLHTFLTRSGMSAILSPTRPPNTTVSIAPSNSGNEYSTTDCKPSTPFDCHMGILCSNNGLATIYGTSILSRRAAATSTFRPASIDPAGPPTRGNPIVDTMASTHVASLDLYVESLTIVPVDTPSISCVEVNQSLTIVCASTPLMNTGTGINPSDSKY